MAIGGMALAIRLRELWPELILNETHPKVLYYALARERYRAKEVEVAVRWFLDHARLDASRIHNDHEFNAVISAWATRAGLLEGWEDFVIDDPSLLFPAGRVRYLWPNLPQWPSA
jgi:hypothetical protein